MIANTENRGEFIKQEGNLQEGYLKAQKIEEMARENVTKDNYASGRIFEITPQGHSGKDAHAGPDRHSPPSC